MKYFDRKGQKRGKIAKLAFGLTFSAIFKDQLEEAASREHTKQDL